MTELDSCDRIEGSRYFKNESSLWITFEGFWICPACNSVPVIRPAAIGLNRGWMLVHNCDSRITLLKTTIAELREAWNALLEETE